MSVWEYVSAIIFPALQNPIIIYLIVLAIIGADAYSSTLTSPTAPTTMVGLIQVGGGDPNDPNSLNYDCLHPSALTSFIRSIPFLNTFHACTVLPNVTNTNGKALGIAGSMLTTLFRAWLPAEFYVSSVQLFFVMLFLPIIIWVVTHQLGRR